MVRSVFPYPGGKTYLAPWIIEHFREHRCYVDVFGGSASLLVNKQRSKVEVFNDLDDDITHFFEVLRDQGSELRAWLEETPYTKKLHDEWSKAFYNGKRPDDDVERAGRFFYLRYSQFSGKYSGPSGFSTAAARNVARKFKRGVEELEYFTDRLRHVQVTNRDYAKVLERFDSDETLFYLDPPYMDEGDVLYSHEGNFNHGRLAEILDGLEGWWIVSYMRVPEPLQNYHIVEREAAQHMRKGQPDKRRDNAIERLIMNYDPYKSPSFVEKNQTTLTELAD